MTATDAQVRLLMKERSNGKTQEQAAIKANLCSRKTVQKYEQLGQLPSDLKESRGYRTRPDPFEKDWAEVEAKLAVAPELEAKAIFEWLCERNGTPYQEGQLRTLQRRVSNWRALHSNPTLTLDQIHYPGEVLQSDGTCMNELEVTLQGEPFEHILFHSVLPYSNWEWGRVVQSESLLSIRLGLQSTLLKLGYVPQAHQTDHTTAATHTLGVADRQSLRERGYNEEYLQLLAHYGLEARTIHLSSPNENGDVKSSNGGLKRAVKQHLLLRGSRDFESVAAYEAFLFAIMEKRNAGRQARLAEEIVAMRPLTAKPWPQIARTQRASGAEWNSTGGQQRLQRPQRAERQACHSPDLRVAYRGLVCQPAHRDPAACTRRPPLPDQLPPRDRQPAAQTWRISQLPLPR